MLADERNHCRYKEKVLWAYLKALEQTDVWPSERVSHGYIVEESIKQLQSCTCSDPHPNGTESCFRCKCDFAIDVKKAIECTRNYFDGLCPGEKQFYNVFNVSTTNRFDRLYLYFEDE